MSTAVDTGIAIGVDASGAISGAKRVTDALDSIPASADRAQKRVGTASSGIGQAIDAIQNASKAAEGAMSHMFEGLGEYLLSPMSALTELAAAFGVEKILDATREYQSFTTTIGAVTGNARAAQGEIKFLNDTVNKYGLSLQTAQDAYATFLASVKNTPLEGQKAREVFVGLSEAITAMHLPAYRAARAFYAMQEIASQGTITAQHLQRQLAIDVPGAAGLMAKGLGVSTDKLHEMIHAGLSADVGLSAMAKAMHDQYGKAAEEAGDMVQGSTNKMHTALLRVMQDMGLSMMPGFGSFAKDVVAALKDIEPLAKSVGSAMGMVAKAIGKELEDDAKALKQDEEALQAMSIAAGYLWSFHSIKKGAAADDKNMTSDVWAAERQRRAMDASPDVYAASVQAEMAKKGNVDEESAKIIAKFDKEMESLKLTAKEANALAAAYETNDKKVVSITAHYEAMAEAEKIGLKTGDQRIKQLEREFLIRDKARAAEKTAKTLDEEYKKIEQQIADQERLNAAYDKGVQAVARVKLENQLADQQRTLDIQGNVALAASLRKVQEAQRLLEQEKQNGEHDKFVAGASESHDERISALRLEIDLRGQVIEAARKGKAAEDEAIRQMNLEIDIHNALNEARKKGIDLTREDIALIRQKITAEDALNQQAAAQQKTLDAIHAGGTGIRGGAKAAWDEYNKGAKDAGEITKQTVGTALDGVNKNMDALVMHQKTSWQELANSIEAALINAITKVLLSDALKKLGKVLTKSDDSDSGDSGGGGFMSWLGNIFSGDKTSSANGNIMTSRGPLALLPYSSGGIANRPQVSLFGEGSTPEAYVPLPDGRSIPVTMKGGGGQQTVQHFHFHGVTDMDSFQKSKGQIGAEVGAQLSRANARNA